MAPTVPGVGADTGRGQLAGILALSLTALLFVAARSPITLAKERSALVPAVHTDREVLEVVLEPELPILDAVAALPAGTPIELRYPELPRAAHEHAQRFWFGLLPRHPIRRGARYAICLADSDPEPGVTVIARGARFVLVSRQ